MLQMPSPQPYVISIGRDISRLLKNAHLRRYPYFSSLRRTSMYASLFEISGALHLDVFEQPEEKVFFGNLPVLAQSSVRGHFVFPYTLALVP